MPDIMETYREKVGEFERARREVEKIRKDVIEDLLRQRREIAVQLRQLGYEGERSEPGRAVAQAPASDEVRSDGVTARFTQDSPVFETLLENGHKRRRFKGAKTFDEAYCALCEIKGHDLRAHRGQEHKRRFSEDELRERGLQYA